MGENDAAGWVSGEAESPIVTLTADQCWTRLQQNQLGRLAIVEGDDIDILPVNYVAVDRTIHFATSSAVIVAALESKRDVAFEADHHDGWTAWSVLAHGGLECSENGPPAGYEIQSILPVPRRVDLQIRPTRISGRLFDQASVAGVGAGDAGAGD